MTNKNKLKEDELEKVNGGITYKPKDEISPNAKSIGDVFTISNRVCSNYNKFPTYKGSLQYCCACTHLLIDDRESFYCEDYADDFHIIDLALDNIHKNY